MMRGLKVAFLQTGIDPDELRDLPDDEGTEG